MRSVYGAERAGRSPTGPPSTCRRRRGSPSPTARSSGSRARWTPRAWKRGARSSRPAASSCPRTSASSRRRAEMGELDGKIAVITGAGSGMGRASAKIFVREGAKVLAADISGREKETAVELGDAVVPFHCDVTQEADVEAMFAAALDTFGRVDAVLNVAGIGGAQPLADIPIA